jgi:DNA-binding transcriptional ArsR family regulator
MNVNMSDLNEPLSRSQATISHHLSVLVKAGLITREQRGKWASFRVAPDRAEFVRSALIGPWFRPLSSCRVGEELG